MIRNNRRNAVYWIAPHIPRPSGRAGAGEPPPPYIAKPDESWIYGALFGHAESSVSGVVFYSPENNPDFSLNDTWGMIELELEDAPTQFGGWESEGKLTVHLETRKEADDIYAGREYAKLLSDVFGSDDLVTVVNDDSQTAGKVRFLNVSSWADGETDGIINHKWQAEIRVFNND